MVYKQIIALTILVGVVGILANYPDYLPPNFRADFLLGREEYFFGIYQWAFYAHLVSGPLTLILGMLLVSERFRRRWPRWHRVLGQVQVATVLLLLLPSGLVMARWAMGGVVAAAGFATLAALTAVTILLGWRDAIGRRFGDHRRWMLRAFTLLASVVVLRLYAGLTTNLELQGNDALAAWLSWLVPLFLAEIIGRRSSRPPP